MGRPAVQAASPASRPAERPAEPTPIAGTPDEYDSIEAQALALWHGGRRDEALALLETRLARTKGDSAASDTGAGAALLGRERRPSPLFFFIIAFALFAAAAYGSMIALVTWVQPHQHEFVVDIPPERLRPAE
jgi:hypothetical protein